MSEEKTVPTTHRKPCVALMGEFSSGKSTLLNLLLDGAPFPVQVTATRLPPIWASHGEKSATLVGHDGSETDIAVEDIASVALDDAALIRLTRETEILEICDLVDMPGISDPNMPAQVWQSTLDEVDCVIWCTHATQAWRQSEAAIWERALPATNGRNILLVTQIDKLRNPRDRKRVMTRVRRETDGLFEAIFPISVLQAMESEEDETVLEESGMLAFLNHLVGMLLKPLDPQESATVEWDTVPELPTHEASENRRITPATTPAVDDGAQSELHSAMPDQNAPEANDAAEAVIPKRVAKPKRYRTRPIAAKPIEAYL
ncbi:GTPase [Alisedimentitalea sp. MJ-SS2]|uniref:dynamin family protein n=1 Tax=Aliisedimentitalea sp. MJ-SS2 TaxID=3049795 RepID=UPI0029148A6D|nr:dynamin family protein [Alisedimentitalea sp. MJ-SS2]MDU8927836.1 GTPase [Alisedimentitalea sp. MJ-SS2]